MATAIYTFDNSDLQAPRQLASLEATLDPVTVRRITEMGLPAEALCWEIGAGGGSVAAWLSSHVASRGHIVATDINTAQLGRLATLDNVTVAEHDISTLTAPAGGPFDLIHARLVLLHLPSRERILTTLVDQLSPGGWLLLEEFDCTQPLYVYNTASPDDAELFGRVTDAIITILEQRGADMHWARRVHPAMREAGLQHIHTITHTESWPGGSPGARLHHSNSHQLAPQLHQLGFTDADLATFRDIVDYPHHAAASYQLVSTRGRRLMA